jgi:hypothetical protein
VAVVAGVMRSTMEPGKRVSGSTQSPRPGSRSRVVRVELPGRPYRSVWVLTWGWLEVWQAYRLSGGVASRCAACDELLRVSGSPGR